MASLPLTKPGAVGAGSGASRRRAAIASARASTLASSNSICSFTRGGDAALCRPKYFPGNCLFFDHDSPRFGVAREPIEPAKGGACPESGQTLPMKKMGVVTAFALLALGFASFAVGTPSATVGCGTTLGACSCPSPFVGPGWCPTNGAAPCNCPWATLCAGWCLVQVSDAGYSEPAPCDAGAE
jgi:hypothetical protein